MRNALIIAAVAASLGLGTFAGCKSSGGEGVKTNYRTQWTNVSANTADATTAARTVLESEGLRDVTSSSTRVDGTASGKKADGTKVNVSIQRKTESTSEVSVNVGTLGDPSLGAELARKIKEQAEGGATTRTSTITSSSATTSRISSTRRTNSD